LAAVLTKDAKLSPSASPVEVELGIWLSSLESFLRSGPNAFFAANAGDRSREAHIVHAALLRVSMLAAMLTDPADPNATSRDLRPLAKALRDATLIVEPVLKNKQTTTAEYNALRSAIADRLADLPAAQNVISTTDAAGAEYLPSALLSLTQAPELDREHAELALVLPRFGRVLKYLDVIGDMLERDEPLKPSILIFTRVNEMIYELTTFINNRLERFPDAEAEMFATLDAASYTASMELKKVYGQELAGVSELRPAPSIYARTETAYSLLHDGFQLILTGFARTIDPSADLFTVFPEFKTKREQSAALRRELNDLIKIIQAAEADPDDRKVDALKSGIREFMIEAVNYLFYKDTETVERFVEEITLTRTNTDLVPLLHRFGAYLDTLLGQVSLRAVLVDQM
jgi:hypothetical protein